MLLARQREIVAVVRELSERRLVVGSTGNVSARTATGFLITPTRRRYDALRAWDVVEVGPRRRRRGPPPSRETGLHASIYAAREDVAAIVHHHGPYATACSFDGGELRPRLEESEYFGFGPVRIAAPAPAGSKELAAACLTALGRGSAVLLAGHGMIATGPDLRAALDVALAVEHQAHVSWLLRTGAVRLTRTAPVRARARV